MASAKYIFPFNLLQIAFTFLKVKFVFTSSVNRHVK